MMRKLVMVASALSLVACGAGEPWEGPDGGPPPGAGAGNPHGGSAVAGSGPIGGSQQGMGGSAPWPGGGYGGATGGTAVGGAEPVGGEGGASEGGYAGTWGSAGEPAGEGGTGHGGEVGSAGEGGIGGYAGSGGTGTGGGAPDLNCLASVSRCFDAAANCFEFSPGSDCDQIVDVCAAMQANCESAAP